LSVVESVEVKVEVQIVFKLCQSFHLTEVTRFESRVEEECALSDVADVYRIALVLQNSVLLGLLDALEELSQDLLL